MRRGRRGLAAQQLVGSVARRLDQSRVALQIGEAEQRHAGLPRPQEFAGAAEQQVTARVYAQPGEALEITPGLVQDYRIFRSEDAIEVSFSLTKN